MAASLENEMNYISYSRPGDKYGKLGNMAGGMPSVVKGDAVWSVWPDENCVMQGGNGMGEILMMIRDCLRNNTEPSYNKDLLNQSGIYFLGERLTF